ncbi:MAG: SigB/SigF/SigG family RNA polymerase sigma factor [Solirubrobacterales bacterium]|nr:SigB/SigF/SigG family RNA polymerase sigma factor [Solirubrobacterales bacterium]
MSETGTRSSLVGVESQQELFCRWRRAGDSRAREELIRRLLPLARKLARRYANGREPLDDLIQVASLALVKAVDRFDPDRGLAFSSFAVPTILGELKRYFRDTGWAVHVPRGVQELALKVSEAERQLSGRAGRSVSVQELAVYLEASIEDVVDALEAAGGAHHAVSLDLTEGDGDERASLAHTLGSEDQGYERVEARVTIAQVATDLPEHERRVLRLYHLEDRTQAEVATALGVSQMHVSRLQRRAIKRLTEIAAEHQAK